MTLLPSMLSDEELRQRIESLRMTPEDFERLPESVKADVLKKRADAELRAAKYQQRQSDRTRNAMLLSAAGSFVVGVITPGNWLYPIMLVVTAGIQGYVVVKYKLSHLSGIILYGMGAVLATIFSGNFTGEGFSQMMVFCSWLFQMGIGLAIAKMIEGQRVREDSF